jgi:hypothetical protein
LNTNLDLQTNLSPDVLAIVLTGTGDLTLTEAAAFAGLSVHEFESLLDDEATTKRAMLEAATIENSVDLALWRSQRALNRGLEELHRRIEEDHTSLTTQDITKIGVLTERLAGISEARGLELKAQAKATEERLPLITVSTEGGFRITMTLPGDE